MRKKIMNIVAKLLRLKPSCAHHEYVVLKQLGPTGRGKVWQCCQCKSCQGYFTQELMSGKRFNTEFPTFGFKQVI